MNTDLEFYEAPSVPALPERLSLPEILETAKILAASGYFPTAKEAGQAAAKIMWGQDMGLTPMQAMTGIHVWIQSGAPTMQVSAKVITYLLKRHGLTWEFVQHDAEACEVEVYRHGKRLEPNVRFTKAQAAKAGLASKPVWTGYGEDMLWHRVAGRIADRFAPEIFDAAAIPVMTTEQAESTYPDPRDDLVKALHATYREVYPQELDETPRDYRLRRLFWSCDVLGREDIGTWNGPQAPETLTRADVQTLLAALDSTPALTREQPAPSSSPDAASAAGAGSMQGSAVEDRVIREATQHAPATSPAEHHTAEVLGEVAPADGAVPEDIAPAEHHTEPSGGQAATHVGTGSEAGDGSPKPSGGTSAPTRKRHPTDRTGAPGVKEAAKQATAPRPQTYQYIPPSSWFWTLPTHAGRPILEHFGNVMKAAEAWLKPIAEQESDKPLAEWGELDNWSDAKVNVILAALEAEKAGAQ